MQKRKQRKTIVGEATFKIQSAPRQRSAILFVTRCANDTTCISLQDYVTENVTEKYPVKDIVEVPNTHHKHKSFKVTFNLLEEKLSACFKEILSPSLWPKDVTVKPFQLRPQTKSPFQKKSEMGEESKSSL